MPSLSNDTVFAYSRDAARGLFVRHQFCRRFPVRFLHAIQALTAAFCGSRRGRIPAGQAIPTHERKGLGNQEGRKQSRRCVLGTTVAVLVSTVSAAAACVRRFWNVVLGIGQSRQLMLDRTLGIVLAGGVGSRLNPLTLNRAKPAVPFGGKYRIIDFTLSNCYHSGLRQILVLTQYKSHSLQKHLRDGWSIFNPSIGEYITAVPAQMRTGTSWYQGTADAVYQNLYLLERSNADKTIILSGDHIYRMDYASMLQWHVECNADATIACMRVPLHAATSFGVVAVNGQDRIVDFQEKPRSPRAMPDDPEHALASMGIYVFRNDLLQDVLKDDHARQSSTRDFGKDILPRLIQKHAVHAYRFGGDRGRVTNDRYWRDVGTIDAFYQANLDLLELDSPMDLYQRDWTIRTNEAQAPPARTAPSRAGAKAEVHNSILSSGSVITGGNVAHSILFRNVRVDEHAVISNSLLFDEVEVAAGVQLQRCIVDKRVRIPPGERIGFDRERDQDRFTVSENGVVVIPSGFRF